MRRWTLAALICSLLLPAAAQAAEEPVAWELASKRIPAADAREVRLAYVINVCDGDLGPVQRVSVDREARSITITVYDAFPNDTCPGVLRTVKRSVDLGGRLGRRSLFDGATGTTVVAGEVPSRWAPANKALLAPGQRRLSILVTVGGCTGLPRTVVRRGRRSVTITVLQRVDTGPYAVACGAPVTQERVSVSLRGRLGHRSIRDGSASPPRVVFPAPKR